MLSFQVLLLRSQPPSPSSFPFPGPRSVFTCVSMLSRFGARLRFGFPLVISIAAISILRLRSPFLTFLLSIRSRLPAFLALLALLALPAALPLALPPPTSQTTCLTPYYLPYSPHLLYSPSSLSFCDFVVFGFPWRCGRVFPMIVCHLFCYKP